MPWTFCPWNSIDGLRSRPARHWSDGARREGWGLNNFFTTFCQALPMRKAMILVVLTIALPALAAGEKKEGEVKKGPAGTNVDMPYLMAPLTNAEGKLAGYAYLSTRLTALSDIYALAVREKLAFIQDVMVRDV